MSTKTKKPAADTIGDLRKVYLHIFDSFSVHGATSVTEQFPEINSRYARELLGTLTDQSGLVIKDEDEDGGDMWQAQPTYDNITREDAEALFDEWAAATGQPVKADKPAKAKPRETSTHPCYCGCGEQVPAKSFYRPGHDARHAGKVGREAAEAHFNGQGDWLSKEFYGDLPSERLVEKAKGIATKAVEKQKAKDAKKAGPVLGEVKVGKNTRPARRNPDGTVEYQPKDDVDEWKAASKAATATFTEAA